MHENFDLVVNRKGTLSVKWNRDAIASICGNPDAEPFWVADMDFTVAQAIKDAVVEAAETGVYGYPHFDGNKEAFCSWAKERHDWNVSPDHVVICQGVLSSIALLTEQLTAKGDGIIVPMPAYQPFIRIVQGLERNLVRWPLLYDKETHTFSADWDSFAKLCETNKLVLFCNPHNPSGIEFGADDLTRLCTIAKEHGTVIICDEIHADLAFGKHIPLPLIASQCGAKAITCMAPSKTFNIAGEHFSVVVTEDKEIREGLEKRKAQLFCGETSYFSTTAAITAYKNGFSWLMELLPYLQENISFIDTYFKEQVPELVFIKPHASFIGFIDCAGILPLVEADAKAHPELYDPKESPAGGIMSRFFGQRASVAVNDGTWFGGEEYRQFVRFNYGVRKENIVHAMERIKLAVNFLKNSYQEA